MKLPSEEIKEIADKLAKEYQLPHQYPNPVAMYPLAIMQYLDQIAKESEEL